MTKLVQCLIQPCGAFFPINAVEINLLYISTYFQKQNPRMQAGQDLQKFSSRPLPSCASPSPPARPIIISNQSVSHRTSPTDLSSIVPSLITYQILHRPASQVSPSPVLSQVSPIQEINMKDLPPSYSVLDLHSELPSYYEATK